MPTMDYSKGNPFNLRQSDWLQSKILLNAPSYLNLDLYVDQAFSQPPAADLPTISFNSVTTTALTTPKVFKPAVVGLGSQTLNWDGKSDTNFRYAPGVFYTANGGASDLALYGVIKPFGNAQAARWPVITTFETSAATVEVFSYGGANESFMLKVNDRYVSEAALDRSSVATNGILMTLTFPSAKVRKITLIDQGFTGLSEVRIPNTAGLWKPKNAPKRTIAVVGDSFVGGSSTWNAANGGGALQCETWAFRLMHLMGADGPINAGIGGTGWVAGNDGGNPANYITRLDQVVAFNPDIVILYGSVNDAQAGTGVQAAAEAALDKLYNVPEVFVVSTFTAGWEAHRDALKTATANKGRNFVDMAGTLFGSGKTGTLTGDGNADYLKNSDGTHPSTEGHRFFTRRVFEAIMSRYGV